MKKKESSDKTGLKLSIIFSSSALIISVITLYFQFFNVKHTVLYSSLEPEINYERKELYVPILFKNKGNQTEVILKSYLMIEVKQDSNSFYKRISPLTMEEYPLVLLPGDNKLLKMTGNYHEYLFGTYEISETHFKYNPITEFDSLNFIMNVTYLTSSGELDEEYREIGSISFDEKENIKRIDCKPIKLRKLDINKNDREIVSYSIVPQTHNGSFQIDLSDTNSIIQNQDKILFLNKILSDTLQ